jgi:quercetin dioxygenase-like cupin family protein
MRFDRISRTKVLGTMVGTLALVWFSGQQSGQTISAQAGQSNFMGGAPTTEDSKAVRTARLRFAAGSRSNWHSHSWGQLLMVEQGRGRTQVRGGPVQEVGPGQPWFTKAGVEHWHGAAPDQDMLQLTIYEGTVKWLEPVTDKEYRAPAGGR